MRLPRYALGVICMAALCVCASAQAGFVNLGSSGWRAEWDSSLDPHVNITVVAQDQDAVYIQKEAEFTQGPVNGVFPSIPIVFRQIAFPAVTNIVIDREVILNNTGFNWSDFHIDLLDGGDAVFNPAATAASGGGGPIGFSVAPFLDAAFGAGDTRLDIENGVVANGTFWTPGSSDVAPDQLWISVNPHASAPFTIFTMKETPTPEPASLVLLALGGAAVIRRRK